MKNARQTVRDFIAKETLDEARVDALMAMRSTPQRRLWPVFTGLGAVAITAALLMVILLPSGLLEERIADEVAANHLRGQPAEVHGSSFPEIAAYFDKLDFRPVVPAIAAERWTLTGGRYCSLLGRPAAQFNYRFEPDGSLHTLYQAPYDRDAYRDLPRLEEGEPPRTVSMRGVDVAIWVQKGVLFALTDPRHTGL